LSFKAFKLRRDSISQKRKLRPQAVGLIGGSKALAFEKFEEILHSRGKHKVQREKLQESSILGQESRSGPPDQSPGRGGAH
jgi:hypothetical protein